MIDLAAATATEAVKKTRSVSRGTRHRKGEENEPSTYSRYQTTNAALHDATRQIARAKGSQHPTAPKRSKKALPPGKTN